MALTDTSPESRRVYYQRLAGMTPSERVRIGVSLWQAAYALQRASILRRNPEADDAEVNFQIAVSRFGPELARAAWKRV
ncbi:MAG: hypothetical protein ABJC09_08780 [Terriglobia bacterium]